MIRIQMHGIVFLSMILLLAGCGMKDTGERRIRFKIQTYEPPVDMGYDQDVYSQILIWPEEYWENILNGEQRIVSNSEVMYNDTLVQFSPTTDCFRMLNTEVDAGGLFTIEVIMDDHKEYVFTNEMPAIYLQGHRATDYVSPGDSVRYRWSSSSPNDGKLVIKLGKYVVRTIKGSGEIIWYIYDSDSGNTYNLEFIHVFEFPSQNPFQQMMYEHRAYSSVVVP